MFRTLQALDTLFPAIKPDLWEIQSIQDEIKSNMQLQQNLQQQTDMNILQNNSKILI